MDLKELALVDPDTHWYYQSKLVPLKRALRRWGLDSCVFVDVGAGSGFFSKELSRSLPGSKLFCVDPNYPAEYSEGDGRIRFVKSLHPAELRGADTLLFIDVLEHVSDDRALLEEYVTHIRPGALVLMTVPAFMCLWSGHDVYLEHFRRYRRHELVLVAEAAGLEVVHSQYLFGSIFPLAWLIRRALRRRPAATNLRPAPSVLNVILKLLVRIEHNFFWNPFFGLSVFVVAKVGSESSRSTCDRH